MQLQDRKHQIALGPGTVRGKTIPLSFSANTHWEGGWMCWRGGYILSNVTRKALTEMFNLRPESLREVRE